MDKAAGGVNARPPFAPGALFTLTEQAFESWGAVEQTADSYIHDVVERLISFARKRHPSLAPLKHKRGMHLETSGRRDPQFNRGF